MPVDAAPAPGPTVGEPLWDDAAAAEACREPTAAEWAAAPTDEELWGMAPDPDIDPPAGMDLALAVLPADLLAAATRPRLSRQLMRAGVFVPSSPHGAGFSAGGAADDLSPGALLAGLAGREWDHGLTRVSDDALVGLMRAWRRLASWATAGEAAAIAELDRRRNAQVAAGADPHLAEHVPDEIAPPLTLTSRSADLLHGFACRLAGLPRTMAALAAGRIDSAKAHVIADGMIGLTGVHAAAVETAVIGPAARQTTGELRAALRRAVLAADPTAARTRREEARKDARVEVWDEPAGTAAIAGRDLPAADVLAADRHLTALARHLQQAGAEGSLAQLRARAYLALLLGSPVGPLVTGPRGTELSGAGPDCSHPRCTDPRCTDPRCTDQRCMDPQGTGLRGTGPHGMDPHRAGPHGTDPQGTGSRSTGPHSTASLGTDPHGTDPQGTGPHSPGPRGAEPDGSSVAGRSVADRSCGGCRSEPHGRSAPPLAASTGTATPAGGSINLTLPLSTLLDGSSGVGEVPGFGPVSAEDAQRLARRLSAVPRTRWCITLTGSDGRAVAHGCVSRQLTGPWSGPGGTGADWELQVTIKPLATTDCRHRRETASYRPPAGLAHLVKIRQPTCTYPGCRHAAGRCDLDHTVPHHLGGRTCECNLAPLCRRHHQVKQAQGWRLRQRSPGVFEWQLPHGRTYRVRAAPYPPAEPAVRGEHGFPANRRPWAAAGLQVTPASRAEPDSGSRTTRGTPPDPGP